MPNSNDNSPQDAFPVDLIHNQGEVSSLDPDLFSLLFEDEPPVSNSLEPEVPTVGVKRSRPTSLVISGVRSHHYYFKEHRQNRTSFTFEENLHYYKITPELYKQFSSVFDKFTASQIQRIAWQLNSEETIRCLIQNYDFLTGIFQPEQITSLAEHALGYENINCLIKNNNILLLMLKFKLTTDRLVKLMSFKFGFKNLLAVQQYSEKLKRIGFTNSTLVSIASHPTGEKKLAVLARYAESLLVPPIELSLQQLVEFVSPNGGDTIIELIGKYPHIAKKHITELEKTNKIQRRNKLERYIALAPGAQKIESARPISVPVEPPPGKVMIPRLNHFWDTSACPAESRNSIKPFQP